MEIAHLMRLVQARQNAMEQALSLYGDRLAPEFNPFQFIEPGELKLSRIIAWLLDAKGNHAQGPRFLQLLLTKIGARWPAEALDDADVKTEFPIAAGQMDIHAQSGIRILAIENKPWAADGDQQLFRYFSYLDRQALSDCDLIYLNTDGSGPAGNSLGCTERNRRQSDGQLHLWSYRSELLD
jgi:hypothetical protein